MLVLSRKRAANLDRVRYYDNRSQVRRSGAMGMSCPPVFPSCQELVARTAPIKLARERASGVPVEGD